MGKILQSTKPLRMWIDGTCFNIIKRLEKIKKTVSHHAVTESANPIHVDDNLFALTKIENNFTTSFQLPSMYCIRLNDFPGFNIKTLETETNTNISIPKDGGDGSITISGNNEVNVINARHSLHSVISEIRLKQSAAQFICIPVQSEEVQRNFEQFKEEILSGDNIQGVDATIFQSSLKLHVTIGVFALMDNSEKEEAVAALNACRTEIIQPFINNSEPLKIKVAGIDCMNSNYSKVHVLYANARIEKLDEEDLLQRLTNGISNYFYERGLLIQHTDNVKLHVTLMNTKYRRFSTGNTPKKSRWGMKRQPFDATGIVQKYKDFYFGETTLDSVHLSYISSQGEDGFYKPLSIVTF